MFPTSSNLLTCADLHAEELLHIITQNLKDLANNFDYDFPEHELLWNWNLWIKNPFIEDANTCELNLCEEESWLEMCCDTPLLSIKDVVLIKKVWECTQKSIQLRTASNSF